MIGFDSPLTTAPHQLPSGRGRADAPVLRPLGALEHPGQQRHEQLAEELREPPKETIQSAVELREARESASAQ